MRGRDVLQAAQTAADLFGKIAKQYGCHIVVGMPEENKGGRKPLTLQDVAFIMQIRILSVRINKLIKESQFTIQTQGQKGILLWQF